jgi:predicted ATP-grasp superfamily ATP-dependent carboligase
VKVGVLTTSGWQAAAWSRFTNDKVRGFPETSSAEFLSRLLAVGANEPGQILLPTSDETLWLYTLHKERLAQSFLLNQPSIECVRRILDKKLFAEVAQAAGFPVVPIWEPSSEREVESLAPSLPYPILIKPRSHVRRLTMTKGVVVYSQQEMAAEYKRFVAREIFLLGDEWESNTSVLPLLQRFVPVGREGVCSVSGYIDRSGELFVTRRCVKVFQRFKPVGIGICFETRPNDPELSASVRRLCKELDYFGIFEVEFLRYEGEWTPIDFNGRLFHQLALDIKRGMPLPLFACLEAAGMHSELRSEIDRAQRCDFHGVLLDSFTFHTLMAAQRLTGRTTVTEQRLWKQWIEENAAHTIDLVESDGDRLPAWFHMIAQVYRGLRAWPRFLRSIPRVRTSTRHFCKESEP